MPPAHTTSQPGSAASRSGIRRPYRQAAQPPWHGRTAESPSGRAHPELADLPLLSVLAPDRGEVQIFGVIYVSLSVGDGLLVTLCHPGQAFPLRLARSAALVTVLRVHGHTFGSEQGV